MPDGIDLDQKGGATPVDSTIGGQVTPIQTPLGFSGASTLAPSQQSQVDDAKDATVPVLMPPAAVNDVFIDGILNQTSALYLMKADSDQNKMVIDMLDQWNKSIKLIHEKFIQNENSVSAKILDDIHSKNNPEKNVFHSTVSNIVDAYIKSANPSLDATIPMMAIGLIFAGSGGIEEALFPDITKSKLVGIQPTQDQAQAIPINPNPDMRAELGLLGAAMLQGAMAAALLINVFKDEKVSDTQKNQDTAKTYSEAIIAFCSSAQLENTLANIYTAKSDSGKPTDQKFINTLTAKLKTMLLATALIALYSNAEEGGTGHLIGEDLLGLLSGENQTFGPNKDLMDKILGMIKTQLGKLSPEEKEDLLNALADFADTNPNMDILTNPSKAFPKIQPYLKRDPGETQT